MHQLAKEAKLKWYCIKLAIHLNKGRVEMMRKASLLYLQHHFTSVQ